MKKLSILVASVVLGVSGIAAAAPNVHVLRDQTAYRPDRGRPMAYSRWTVLDSKSLRNGRDVIRVNTDQRFTKLKLEATSGIAAIDKVLVTFANGRTQVIEVDQRLGGRGSSSTILDLAGNSRQIKSIVIYGEGGRFRRGGVVSVSAA